MKPGQLDRRVRRTRQLLNDALLALMHERPYDDITVQDILERADVGRSTFYTHFYDKDDLLLNGFARLHKLFEAHPGQPTPAEPFSLAFFRHVTSYRAEYRALLGNRDGEQVLRQVERFLVARLSERLEHLVPPGSTDEQLRSMVLMHAASALFGLMAWWFEHDRPYSPEQMSVLYSTMVLPGLCELLQIDRAVAGRLL